MTGRVMQEIKRLQQEGPSEDLTNRAKESARRSYETALKQNDYWLRRLQSINMLGGDPAEILTRGSRIDAVTRQGLQDVFKRYFPADRSTIVTLVPAPAAAAGLSSRRCLRRLAPNVLSGAESGAVKHQRREPRRARRDDGW